MDNKVQKESSLTLEPSEADENLRSVAVGGGERRYYFQWKLHYLAEGVFISTPASKLQRLELSPDLPGGTSARASQTDEAEASMPTKGDGEYGCQVSFVHLPFGDSSRCSSDAQRFSLTGQESGDDQLPSVRKLPGGFSVRQLLTHDGHVYALAENLHINRPNHSRLFRQHPSGPGKWQELELPLKEEGQGQRFSHLASFRDRLYLVMDDEIAGFHLWSTEVGDSLDTEWVVAITNGAGQYSSNAHVTAVYVEAECMLIACAATKSLAGFPGRPVGAELIVVRESGWDLIAGTTRLGQDGLVVPLGAVGRGFDDSGASVISSISCSGGEYFVTLHSRREENAPVHDTLWTSQDLFDWTSVELPPMFEKQNMTLLGAARQGGFLLLAAQRPLGSLAVQYRHTHVAPEVVCEALPQGVELWLAEYAD
jgi:hypothetical protein